MGRDRGRDRDRAIGRAIVEAAEAASCAARELKRGPEGIERAAVLVARAVTVLDPLAQALDHGNAHGGVRPISRLLSA